MIDPEVDPRNARMLVKDQFPTAPSGRGDDQVVVAIDDDGDGTADLVFVQYQCDDVGNASPTRRRATRYVVAGRRAG